MMSGICYEETNRTDGLSTRDTSLWVVFIFRVLVCGARPSKSSYTKKVKSKQTLAPLPAHHQNNLSQRHQLGGGGWSLNIITLLSKR